MKDFSSRFANLLDKVETLLVKHAKAREENQRLREELAEYRRLQQDREEQIRELDAKITVLKTAKEITGDDEDKVAIRQKVNEYIREIDRCIAMLNG